MNHFFKKSHIYLNAEAEFTQSVDALRRTLDQQQRRLLLRIVDSSTLKEECGARSAFPRGLSSGLQAHRRRLPLTLRHWAYKQAALMPDVLLHNVQRNTGACGLGHLAESVPPIKPLATRLSGAHRGADTSGPEAGRPTPPLR